MWAYNSPNFINDDIFCFNKKKNMQLSCGNAVTCTIVATYSAVHYKILNDVTHLVEVFVRIYSENIYTKQLHICMAYV